MWEIIIIDFDLADILIITDGFQLGQNIRGPAGVRVEGSILHVAILCTAYWIVWTAPVESRNNFYVLLSICTIQGDRSVLTGFHRLVF